MWQPWTYLHIVQEPVEGLIPVYYQQLLAFSKNITFAAWGTKWRIARESHFPCISDLNQKRFHRVFTEAGVVLSKDLGQIQVLPAPGDRYSAAAKAPEMRVSLWAGTCTFSGPASKFPQQNRNLQSWVRRHQPLSSLTTHASPGSCTAGRPACTGATPLLK